MSKPIDTLQTSYLDESSTTVNISEAKEIRISMLRPSSLKVDVRSAENDLPTASSLDSDDVAHSGPSFHSGKDFETLSSNMVKPSTETLRKNCPVIAATIPISEHSNYVFGQNIHERVLGDNIQKPPNSSDSVVSNEVSDNNLLFSKAIHSFDDEIATLSTNETDKECLTEAARVYEESRARKRKFDTVETFTGEEGEINIAELNCKIFAFIDGNWEERGRGSLRLNDDREGGYSRVVFRTSGNLRVLLNTKIWPQMAVQRPSNKSMRFTAIDSMEQIKIFLVMSRPDDVTVMYNALIERVDSSDNKDKETKSSVNIDNCSEYQEPNQKKIK